MCKTEEAETIVKDGSNDVLFCKKCYYCSKCKTNRAVAQFAGDKQGKIFYQGSICKVCIRELPEFKCEICKAKSSLLPNGNVRTKLNDQQQEIRVCESCLEDSQKKKQAKQKQKEEINQANPNQLNSSSSDGANVNSSSKSKCLNCGVREAEHAGSTFTIQKAEGGKEVASQPICDPCLKSLEKCSWCNNNPGRYTFGKGSGSFVLCEECCKKYAERDNLIGELEYKIRSILQTREKLICFAIKEKKATDLSLEKWKELKDLLIEADKKEVWDSITSLGAGYGKLSEYLGDGRFSVDKKIKELEGETKQKVSNEMLPKTPQTKSTNPNECCEGCGISCKIKGKVKRTKITSHRTNFTTEEHFFGTNCSCLEEYKRTHPRTCTNCQKQEWPDMKKGWLLDYEIKRAFCSPICHVKYRESQWKQEQLPKTKVKELRKDLGKRVELYPMELTLSDGGKKDFDWEKEASKKKVLTLKKLTKVLSSSESKPVKSKPKRTKTIEPDYYYEDYGDWDRHFQAFEREMAEMDREFSSGYFSSFANNSYQKAQKVYADKYGKTELNALLSGKQQVQPPKMNKTPLIIGGGLLAVGIIGGLAFYFLKVRKVKQN